MEVENPDGGEAVAGVGGHFEVEDEHFGACPAVIGCAVAESVAWGGFARGGGDDVLFGVCEWLVRL